MKKMTIRLFVCFFSLALILPSFSMSVHASDIWGTEDWEDGSDSWWDSSDGFENENISPSATSGKFGDSYGFKWTYDKAKDILTITGEDEGIDELTNYLPKKVRSNTKKVVFKDCVVTGGTMCYMFAGLRDSLKSVDFSGLDTTNVEDMSYMFNWCENLKSVDLTGLDTSNVEDMTEMFSWCESLTDVNMSGLNTSKVTDMSCMFMDCTNLVSVNFKGLDTSSVEDMTDMFDGCDKLNRVITPKVMADDMYIKLPTTFGDYKNNNTKEISSEYCNKTLAKAYKITYKLDGGTNNTGNPSMYNETVAAITLKNPKKTGYTFGGWYSDSKFKNRVKSIAKGSTGNKTLYAKWTVNKYTIAFKGNKSTSGSLSSLKNCEYGKSYTLKKNTFKRTGYSFAGWNTKADGSGTKYNDKASVKNLTVTNGSTVTLYAQWKPIKYAVTYNLNGGVNNSSNPKNYTPESATITLKNPTKNGYTFEGWYSDKNLTKQVRTIKKGSTGNITLYAKWEAEKYAIKYNLDKGKNNRKNPSSYTVLTSNIKLQKPTKTGYKFKGWYSDSSYTKQVKTIKKGSHGNVTLYAKWEAEKYTIKYKLNKGKNNSQNPSSYTVTSATIKLQKPTRNGYTFEGWYSDKKCTKKVKSINKGSTGNKILYAKWKKK